MSKPSKPNGVTRDQVLTFIKEWIAEHGYAPSFREIGDGCGISSLASVSHHVNRLEDEGRLWRPPGKTRAFVVREEVDVGEGKSDV